jgi:hypothetical protein
MINPAENSLRLINEDIKKRNAEVREHIRKIWDDVIVTTFAPLEEFMVGGTKYDGEKPRMDLLDANFLEGVAEVLTFGAKKYAANNWRGGIAVSRLIAASYRHLGAINRGEDLDAESGLPHVYHLGCCVMFLSDMLHRSELDDRYHA